MRFFKYEPGKIGRINNDPHYNASYRTSAAFLDFVSTQHDKDLVRKLNKALREGEYREEIWRALTKKTLKELDDDWRASLKKGPAKVESRISAHFRRRDELHRHLLNQDDFLGGDVFLLQEPFELLHTGNRFRILERIDNQMDMLVNDRLICLWRKPRTRPGREALEI